MGDTWDLFKYPGIRSDSDMYTFGYSFKSWDNPKSFADAPSILKYLNEATKEYKVNDHIVFNKRAISYAFNSTSKLWTVTTTNKTTNTQFNYTCKFLFNCSGNYNYDYGFTPKYKGIEVFKVEFIHPQQWP